MLNKDTSDFLKKAIKEINKEKDLNIRVDMMISLKDKMRNQVNEYLDDLFAEVVLISKKSVLNEEEFLQ